MTQTVPASLAALMEKWRKSMDANVRNADVRSDPYDDIAHEKRVVAGTLKQCADDLEACLASLPIQQCEKCSEKVVK